MTIFRKNYSCKSYNKKHFHSYKESSNRSCSDNALLSSILKTVNVILQYTNLTWFLLWLPRF